MSRIVFFLGTALASANCWGAVYYMDRTGGNDSRDGRSAATAWSTLGRLARAALTAGDYVLLKRGQTWNEALAVPASGLPEAPITFASYGDGPAPVIDGTRVSLPRGIALLDVTGRANLVITGLEIRNSERSAAGASDCSGVTFREMLVTGNRQNGFLVYNCTNVTIERSEIARNSLDLSDSYDGVRIDGNRDISGFRILDSQIHHNAGGIDWRSANGIFIGHTGANIPTIRDVLISGNEIFANGNPNQNQAGRGISGTLRGDIRVVDNYIHHNASAGVYLGDVGLRLDIEISRNKFYNNALRQFGGFTDSQAKAELNLILVDDPSITAMGAEIGGLGSWELLRNTFIYLTDTDDRFRAFIRLNNPEQEQVMSSDYNLYYSAGPHRWKRADDSVLNFQQWQQAGFDSNSRNPR